MTVENQSSGATPETSGASNPEIKEKPIEPKAYTRAIDEAKRAKEKALQLENELSSYRKQLEDIELGKLEGSGKFKDVIETYKKKASEAELKLNQFVERAERESLESKFKNKAITEGALNADDVFTLLIKDFRDFKPSEITDDMIGETINKAKKEKHYLFKKDAKINDMTPSKTNANDLDANIKELDKDKLRQLIKDKFKGV